MENQTKKQNNIGFWILLGVVLLFLFGASQEKSQPAPTPKIGSGITIVNTEVDRPFLDSCSYTIEATNYSTINQNLKIRIELLQENGALIGDYSWEYKPLYTGSPRTDHLNGAMCPAYVQQYGVASIEYILSYSQKNKIGPDIVVEDKTIDVSNKYIDKTVKSSIPFPTPTSSIY